MKPSTQIIIPLLLVLCFGISCSDGGTTDIDEQKPTIDLQFTEGFPQSCTPLVRGQTYQFRARATDNVALASYSLDIHHNFDHHTHDDQGKKCELNPIKQSVNPMIYIQNFSIDQNPTTYEINIPVKIPDDVDTGDYHCQFSVTDRTGWQSRTSVDIKIVE